MKLALSCLKIKQKERSKRWEKVIENNFCTLLHVKKAHGNKALWGQTCNIWNLMFEPANQNAKESGSNYNKKAYGATNDSFDICIILIREYLVWIIFHSLLTHLACRRTVIRSHLFKENKRNPTEGNCTVK